MRHPALTQTARSTTHLVQSRPHIRPYQKLDSLHLGLHENKFEMLFFGRLGVGSECVDHFLLQGSERARESKR